MKKRLVALISAIILSCFIFTGCDSNFDIGTSETVTNNSAFPITTTDEISTVPETTVTSTTDIKTTTPDTTTAKEKSSDKSTTAKSNFKPATNSKSLSLNIPAYSGKPYVKINSNKPYFSKSDYTTKSYEHYSNLDKLGRCGAAVACVGLDIMPTEKRGTIGQIKPTGWHTVKYDCVDGKYLYNRCHLIGYQLTGENANEKNLITGTRYLNVDGMLPFENMVADYVKETHNHVLYRVTPMFSGNNLLANGVLMEAYSVEDDGDGICFNVFCYNVQPDVKINYTDGSSSYSGGSSENKKTTSAKKNNFSKNNNGNKQTYILNTSSKKFHLSSCSSVSKMKEKNKKEYKGNREELINQGYSPCKNCNP